MNKIISNEMQLCQSLIPINPKEGAFIKYKDENYVTIYNAIVDTYGIFKVQGDWSHYYWTPPQEYIYPNINWELIWKEMDYCNYGYYRKYIYNKKGPDIIYLNFKL